MKNVMLAILVLSSIQSAMAEDLNTKQPIARTGTSQVEIDKPVQKQDVKTADRVLGEKCEQGTKLGEYNDVYAGIHKFQGL